MPQDREFEANLVDPSEDDGGGKLVDPSEDGGQASLAEQGQVGETSLKGDGPNRIDVGRIDD